jgi:hypothetical protein
MSTANGVRITFNVSPRPPLEFHVFSPFLSVLLLPQLAGELHLPQVRTEVLQIVEQRPGGGNFIRIHAWAAYVQVRQGQLFQRGPRVGQSRIETGDQHRFIQVVGAKFGRSVAVGRVAAGHFANPKTL